MARSGSLLEAVYANPSSDEARLAYAEFLQERGEPLGEFIALQIARHNRRKGTRTREKELFTAHGQGWWPDHPCAQFSTLALDDIDRGFPARFRQQPTPGVVEDSAKNPAWSTVGGMVLQPGVAEPTLAALFRRGSFPSLRELHGVDERILAEISDLPLPVTSLGVWARRNLDLPVVTGFPELQSLLLDMGRSFEQNLHSVALSGLLSRIRHLEFQDSRARTFEPVLAEYASLPPSIETLVNHRHQGGTTKLSGPRARPELEETIHVTEHYPTIEALNQLGVSAVKVVTVIFAHNGGFGKKSRAAFAGGIQQALSKWGKRATLITG
jgi:uncharacterized protein (TIGR02996 family)